MMENKKTKQKQINLREKEALLSSLRVEFSTPIDVIIGYTQILLDEVIKNHTEEFSSDLSKILEAGWVLQVKVDQLLELPHFSEQNETFDFKKFSSDLQFSLLTPLTSVIGYSELILEKQETAINEQFFSDVRKIHEAARFFIKYVDELDRLASLSIAGIDLLPQFENSTLMIKKVMTSIPVLEKGFVYHHSLSKGSVLVVDDNVMARELLMRRITHYGLNAIASDSSDLFNKLHLQNFDLILLEIMMSHVNGFEILKKLKKNRKYVDIPVIVTSPLNEIDTFIRCLELGADDYLKRPINEVIFQARISASIERKILKDNEKKYLLDLKKEKKKSENLLLNIVPETIAKELKKGRRNIADKFPAVTLIFIDIVKFTEMTEFLSPEDLIRMLNLIFSTFDKLTDKYKLEKIKTIGDSYMAVCGAPIANPLHGELVAEFALHVLKELEILNEKLEIPIQVRIGIHTGPVIAGVIGKKKFMYDLWGETVNLASRLESMGVPGKIQVSESTYEHLKNQYSFKKRGMITVKGVGELNTYFLEGNLK